MDDVCLLTGGGTAELAEAVGRQLGVILGDRPTRASDTEVLFKLTRSVRGKDVYVIPTTSGSADESLFELFAMNDAAHRGGAARITDVLPFARYSRQERRADGRQPIMFKQLADFITNSGATRVVMIDVHAPAVEGFFSIGVDILFALPLFVNYLQGRLEHDAVIVAPDPGRGKLASRYARELDKGLAILYKSRVDENDVVIAHDLVGNVRDKQVVLVDDMITSGSTIEKAVKVLVDSGAKDGMIVVVTHALLVGDAVARLNSLPVRDLVVTDTVPIPPEKLSLLRPELHRITVANMLAEVIRRLHSDQSLSTLYDAWRDQPCYEPVRLLS